MFCFEKHWRREFFIIPVPYEGNKNDLHREKEPTKSIEEVMQMEPKDISDAAKDRVASSVDV